jgi:tripartite-type tricarboxylate transporter receptor subunit TctC
MNLARTLGAAGLAALLAATAAAALSAVTVAGPTYPNKPVRMVVASSPGTASDFFARLVGQSLSDAYRQQVVIDNRSGAGGLIGNHIISRAAPDGYTLGMIGATRIASALLRKDPPYRAVEDIVGVIQVASIPNAVIVAPGVPAKSVQELIALAKAKPGQLNFASVGVGSSSHLAAEIFNRAAGIKAEHVPFKLLADVFTEMASGRIHYCVFTVPSSLPLLREGRLRSLAVTTAKRSTALPDVPTVVEVGMPGALFDNWTGIVAPAGTPRGIVAKLHMDIVRILRAPEVREQFARQGAEPTVDSTPEAFSNLMKAEYARYQKLVTYGVIKPQ